MPAAVTPPTPPVPAETGPVPTDASPADASPTVSSPTVPAPAGRLPRAVRVRFAALLAILGAAAGSLLLWSPTALLD
ncbi:hypothetical protein ACWC5I_21820, partial [Kitasatospora sp. NPDC001574]